MADETGLDSQEAARVEKPKAPAEPPKEVAPLGTPEQNIVDRIDDDGDEDQVLADISQPSSEGKQQSAGLSQEAASDKGQAPEQWLESLSEEQKQIRDSILEGRKSHKAINLDPAFESLLTPSERKLWDSYINKVAFGQGGLSPEESRDFEELSTKLGLREGNREPQIVEGVKEEIPSEVPTFATDVFQAQDLKDPQILQKIFSEKRPEGYNFIFRGTKEPWRPPSLPETEYTEKDKELGQIIDKVMSEGPLPKDSTQAKRLMELTNLFRSEGDQWFSDNPEVAKKYAGDAGSIVRLAVRTQDVFKPNIGKALDQNAGGEGQNFAIPREWFTNSESVSLEQLRQSDGSNQETTPGTKEATPTQDLNTKPETVPSRPEGPIVQRPMEINGVFYDPLHPPKAYQKEDGSMEYRGGKPLERDQADKLYSERFWQRQPKGVRESMIDIIKERAEGGSFVIAVDPRGITDDDREKLSAYRDLAKQIGYEVGEYKFESKSHIVHAPIKKI